MHESLGRKSQEIESLGDESSMHEAIDMLVESTLKLETLNCEQSDPKNQFIRLIDKLHL